MAQGALRDERRASEMTVDSSNLVFLIGAGASVAAPSNLPLFSHLRTNLLSQMRMPQPDATRAELLAPEAFMSALAQASLPVSSWLTNVLGTGRPNAVHATLAEALHGGHIVWTVNADEHIETAFGPGIEALLANDPRLPPLRGDRLLKPHGTTSKRNYVFQAEQVVAHLPSAWAERLRVDLKGADVIVFGYRGADVDLRLQLQTALATASSIRWFAPIQEWENLTLRFPALTAMTTTPVLIARDEHPIELTRLFLSWASQRGLAPASTVDAIALTLSASSSPFDGELPRIQGNLRLARGLVRSAVGSRSSALWDLRAATLTRNAAVRRQAIHAAVGLDLYRPALWARALMATASQPYLRQFIPMAARTRLDRVHVTLLGSHLGQHEKAVTRAMLADDLTDPAILIECAASERFGGRYASAILLSSQARDILRERIPVPVNSLAHALFELSFAQTWSGDLRAAQQTMSEFFTGVDELASVRWIAWAHWQSAAHKLYANRPSEALQLLGIAQQLFSTDALTAGEVAAMTVSLSAYRMLDNEKGFHDTLKRLHRLRDTRGWTQYTSDSITLERAEFLRCRGGQPQARELLESVAAASNNRPIHQALALLGLAEIDRESTGIVRERLTAAKAVLDRHPHAYLAVHLVVTQRNAGLISPETALREVNKINMPLATRTGRAAKDVNDYCLGQHPDRHELYLP